MAISVIGTVKENSTAHITLAFTDQDGVATNPVTASWTLTRSDGSVVNSQEDIVLTPGSSSYDIYLTGDDLPSSTNSSYELLILTVSATYDYGGDEDLPYKAEFGIEVTNLTAVS